MLTKASADRKNLLIAIGGSISVLLGTTGFLLWRNKVNSLIQTQKEELHEKELQRLERAKKLEAASAMLQGQEKERIRIAEDLHDRLGSILAAARMQVEAGANSYTTTNCNLEKAQKMLDQAIDETRSISHNMVSGVLLHLGLVPALNDLKDSLELTGEFEVNLSAEHIPRLELENELELFRITQELVSNSLKHANATKISISAHLYGTTLHLEVSDNGQGYDPQTASTGLGLRNIERRAASINASVQVISSPGNGSRTLIQLDIAHEKTETLIG